MIDEFDNETDEDTADVGGLSVYTDPAVRQAMAKRDALAMQQQARYDAQAKALEEKRYGPSFSERMFQLSAAFATPTKQRGLGAVLANVSPVLAAQQQAKREGEINRREALEQLKNAQLAQQMGLVNQDLSTSIALAKINNKPVVGVDVGGVLRNRSTNQPIGAEYNRVPKAEYYAWIEKNATPTDLAAALEFYPTFTVELKAAFDRGAKNKGR